MLETKLLQILSKRTKQNFCFKFTKNMKILSPKILFNFIKFTEKNPSHDEKQFQITYFQNKMKNSFKKL